MKQLPPSAVQLAEQLHTVSCSILAAHPLPHLCNTVSGLATLTAAACQVAYYCSRTCQVQHWKQHKSTCKGQGTSAALLGSRFVMQAEITQICKGSA